jgi:hypothetical protein
MTAPVCVYFCKCLNEHAIGRPYLSVRMFDALNDNEVRSNFVLFTHRKDELNVGPHR